MATRAGAYTDRRLGWACLDGTCAGGVPASECDLAQIRLTCGALSAEQTLASPAEVIGPASALLGVRPALAGGPSQSTFGLRPSVQRASRLTQQLCAVTVPFSSSDGVRDVLERASSIVNADPGCVAARVTASVPGEPAAPDDGAPHRDHLVLSAPEATGLQLLPVVDGDASADFAFEAVGPAAKLSVSPRVTLSGVALGGTITVLEVGAVGSCEVTIATASGEEAGTVAARLREAFVAPPDPDPWCLPRQNPRDVLIGGDGALRFVTGGALRIQSTDPGLSYTLDGDS